MTEPTFDAIRVATLLHAYPVISEYFILRQARLLGGRIYTYTFNEAIAREMGVEASEVHTFGGGLHSMQVINRLAGYRYGTWSTASLKRLRKALVADRIDVAVVPFGFHATKVAGLLGELGIPFIIQFLGKDASAALDSKKYRREIKKALVSCYRAIVLYGGMRKPFVELGVPESKFEVLPLGVPVDRFVPYRREPDGTFHFVTVGRFTEKKAPLTTIRAFEHCADAGAGVRLTMLGGGELFDQAETYLEGSRHADKVRLLGPQPNEAVVELMRQADCFLQHSVTAPNGDKEGWPTSIGEAAASGLPVIATRHAGIPDQVVHGKTGFLVEEHDTEGMAGYMTRLAADPELARRMGVAARSHLEAHGDVTRIGEQIKLLCLQAVRDSDI